MCLILLAYQTNPDFPFIFAANRDEFYDRPTREADFWEDRPDILGGLDLRDGGTWVGITREGRFAALTNYRDPATLKKHAPTRGALVSDFLSRKDTADRYMYDLEENGLLYNGFNMIFGSIDTLHYYCNCGRSGSLSPGIHGLSNAFLDDPWPKVRRGKEALSRSLNSGEEIRPETFFCILADRSQPDDRDLPRTGVDWEWERILAPSFIVSPIYGTRSATVIIADRRGHVTFEERTFQGQPEPWTSTRYDFTLTERIHEQA